MAHQVFSLWCAMLLAYNFVLVLLLLQMSNNLTDISKTKNILASVLAFIGVTIIICVTVAVSPVLVVFFVVYNIVKEARNPDDGAAAHTRTAERKKMVVSHH